MRSYWCFLSYRHADNKEAGQQWASWLHQSIETYEVPEDLVGTVNGRGDEIPERIFPVFRDEEELPADADLAAPIAKALEDSKTLVVLCSPRAVESKYVAEEIHLYKKLGKSDRIMAALLDGEPNASRDETKDALECFPKPLLHPVGDDGELIEDEWAEPIAADFRLPDGSEGWTGPAAYRDALEREGELSRSERDAAVAAYGKQLELAKLKIIAGILGVPLGTLTKRDKAYQLEKAKKRARVFRAVAAVMALLAIAAVVAGVFAVQKKKEAEQAAEEARVARDDAEGLVYFLTQDLGQDFRDYLPLRLQEQINEEVKAYFERRQEQSELPPSKATWGFWFQLANLQWAADDLKGARESFRESIAVAERMGESGSHEDVEWRELAARSLGWMAEMIRSDENDLDGAEEAAGKSLAYFEELWEEEPENRDWKEGVAISKTRLGGVWLVRQDFEKAGELLEEAAEMRKELMDLEPRNAFRVQRYGVALNRLGDLHMTQEKFDEAYRDFAGCDELARLLLELEPGNVRFRREYGVGQSTLGNVEVARKNYEAARGYYRSAERAIRDLLVWDGENKRWVADLLSIFYGQIDLLKAEERWDEAIALNVERMTMQQELLDEIGRVEHYYLQAMHQREHGELLAELVGTWKERVEWCRKSEATLVASVEAYPDNVYMKYHRAIAANWLGSVLVQEESGKAEAIKALDRAKEVWTSLLEDEDVGEWAQVSLEEQAELYEQAKAPPVVAPDGTGE